MRRSFFLVAPVLAAAVLIGLSLAYETRAPELGATSVEEGRITLRKLIETEGPERAYALLKEKYADADLDLGHAAAHLFGEVLYEHEGASGIAACDADLNFGCYHGLVAAAVRTEGLATVKALDAACTEALGVRSAPCKHGIGHGIVEHLGYGEDELLPALRACKDTGEQNPLEGCTSGVFMAYNIPVVASGDENRAAPRAYSEMDGPYVPCPTLPEEEWRASCYHQLPLWWTRVLDYDFARIGSLCEDLSGEDERACFLGTAKVIASTKDYSVAGTEAACALMPSGWYDACITGASLAFVSLGRTEEGRTLCSFASAEARALCPHQP